MASSRCPRCQGLIVEEYGARRCVNCGHNPDQAVLATTCKYTDCLKIPVTGMICTDHIAIAERKRHATNRAIQNKRKEGRL